MNPVIPKPVIPAALIAFMLLAAGCGGEVDNERDLPAQLRIHNGIAASSTDEAPPTELDLPGRVGWWARRYAAADTAVYRFGPAEGGYVAEGRLVLDGRQDCISLLYRTTERARARDADDALRWALRTRFAGADWDSVVGPDGRVDYDHPAHLDFSVDMIRSGHWGRDVTPQLTGAAPDPVGSSRYPAGSVTWVPEADLEPGDLREGDMVWLVLDPENERAAALRVEYGLIVGHVGVVVMEQDGPHLVHAASSDLPGVYEGGRIVDVPLALYLARVERYGGVIVTRF